MSEAEREERERAIELADELRAVNEALAVRRFAPEVLAEATRLARELRRRLDGPRRTRWYEGFDGLASFDDEQRRAYLDQSPIRGRSNPIAPPLVVESHQLADGRRGVAARARLGMAYEGPPHGVHGGWVAALFDDVLGHVQGLTGGAAVTATLRVRYRDVTPLDEDLRLEGWIAESRGRRSVVRATCHAGERLTAEAEGIFIQVDFAAVRERMRERRT